MASQRFVLWADGVGEGAVSSAAAGSSCRLEPKGSQLLRLQQSKMKTRLTGDRQINTVRSYSHTRDF